MGLMSNKGLQAFLNKLAVLQTKVKSEIENKMQFRCAVVFRNLVYQALVSQKYASSEAYAAYKGRYPKQKAKRGPDMGFWRYNSDLMRAINVFKYPLGKKGWVSGVPLGSVNSDGRDITKYGLLMECGSVAIGDGSRVQEPRALWKPTTNDFAKKEHIKIGLQSLRNIATTWRS